MCPIQTPYVILACLLGGNVCACDHKCTCMCFTLFVVCVQHHISEDMCPSIYHVGYWRYV